MLIQKKIGNIGMIDLNGRTVDLLPIEWYETNKRILHKRSEAGKSVVMKFLKEDPDLRQDDIVFEDESCVVLIQIQPCEAIVVHPATMYEMASLCYEIGNKHLPLFIEGNEVLVPYEAPLFRLLSAAGFKPVVEKRKLLHSIKSSVLPHSHDSGGSLFSKILQLTNPSSHG